MWAMHTGTLLTAGPAGAPPSKHIGEVDAAVSEIMHPDAVVSVLTEVYPWLAAPHGCLSGASLSLPAEVGMGIAIGACTGLWALGVLFVICFPTSKSR